MTRRPKALDKPPPVLRAGRPAIVLPLKPSQAAALRELAREHGTTVGAEIEKAIDAYCLGVTREDVPGLTESITRFNAALDRNSRTLDEVLREIAQSRPRLPRLKRFRLKLPR